MSSRGTPICQVSWPDPDEHVACNLAGRYKIGPYLWRPIFAMLRRYCLEAGEWDSMTMINRPVRKPLRMRGFDYANAGSYFLTICTQNMQEHRFGAIVDGQLMLNDAGRMVASTWEANISRYPDAVLDAFVVMPNHLHAIVFLGTDPERMAPGASISQIVQSFKSVTTVEYTRRVRAGTWPPYERVLWQRGFNDRIIRSDRELAIKQAYIEGNPGRWQDRPAANR